MTSTNETPAIKLSNLKKSFGIGDTETYVLNGINLTVEKGEFIAIMGPSGCGKTTLLNILGLLDQAIEGDYELNGKSVADISRRKQARIRSQEIGYVFQNFNLISRLTIIENVALPLVYKGVHHTKRLLKASEILRNFHLNEREYYMPYQLSGGQVQRVAIARALVNDPTIILADEPTGNLDSRSSDVIMEELCNLHKRGNTIIMVTHNPALTSYASRVITMLDGQIETDTNERFKAFAEANKKYARRKDPEPIEEPEEVDEKENEVTNIAEETNNDSIETILTIEDIENSDEITEFESENDNYRIVENQGVTEIIENKPEFRNNRKHRKNRHRGNHNNQQQNMPNKKRHRHRSKKNKTKRTNA